MDTLWNWTDKAEDSRNGVTSPMRLAVCGMLAGERADWVGTTHSSLDERSRARPYEQEVGDRLARQGDRCCYRDRDRQHSEIVVRKSLAKGVCGARR